MLIPENLLENKKILIGITGSIAAYKTLELIRLFVKAGAEVRAIMSESSKKFITPLSVETLTSNRVLDDTNESWKDDHNHIKIGEWADLLIVAPCTANTLAKISQGIADTILLQTLLAFPKKKLLAPSANTNMIYNSITQNNIKLLQDAKYDFVDTQVKELACKTIGDGAMAEPLQIFWQSSRALLQESFYKDRKVLVTGGGTIEKIDDVRYLSNFSSGKMASALASALYSLGADVKLIATRFEDSLAQGIQIENVQSSLELKESLEHSLQGFSKEEKKPYLFMAAAVSDYIPQNTRSGKLKKQELGENFSIDLKQNTDILSSIDKTKITAIGFKAEMDKNSAHVNATKMLENKKLDAVCLNILENSSSFGSDTNTIDFINSQEMISLSNTDKFSLSFEILKHAKELS
jgi:phosphopantothenoylcysteine decarboxylase/phosphopantothenate--cysteine ligase